MSKKLIAILKDTKVRIDLVIVLVLVVFAAGFAVKSLTISKNSTNNQTVSNQTVFMAAMLGDAAKLKEMSTNDKVFWTLLTHSEKMAYSFGFYVGYRSLSDMFNFNLGKATNGTAAVVRLIDEAYATVAGAERQKLAEVMPKIIWMR